VLVWLNAARFRLFPLTQWREAGKHEVLGTLFDNTSPRLLSTLMSWLYTQKVLIHPAPRSDNYPSIAGGAAGLMVCINWIYNQSLIYVEVSSMLTFRN
jgi:hypothetical protein